MRSTIVAAGITVHEALKAADTLAGDGISVRVIDCYSIKPIDADDASRRAENGSSRSRTTGPREASATPCSARWPRLAQARASRSSP